VRQGTSKHCSVHDDDAGLGASTRMEAELDDDRPRVDRAATEGEIISTGHKTKRAKRRER
jgi:hypothetical protein